MARHEALRTTFPAEDGVPWQRVGPPGPVPLEEHDLSTLEDDVDRARQLARDFVQRPFDLAADLLVRALLVRLRGDAHVVVVVMHHIATDNWSLGLFVEELVALYGGTAPPPLRVQVADHAAWQRAWLDREDGALDAQLRWHAERLAGAPPLALPLDRPRPSRPRFRGARRAFAFDAGRSARVHALARRSAATPFMVLLAAFEILLARLGAGTDLSLGVPVANRSVPEVEPLIGFFANTLVLRTRFAQDAKVSAVIEQVREAALGAFARQDVPFERLVEHLAPARDRARSPLFQAMFVFQNAPRAALRARGLAFEPLDPDGEAAKVDLELTMTERGGVLEGTLAYDVDLFDERTISAIVERFGLVLDAAAANPGQAFDAIAIASSADRELEARWNATARDRSSEPGVLDAIRARSASAPDRTALVFEGEELRYGDLGRSAAELAARLRAAGVEPGALVGIALPRSLELPLAIVAVLEAGAAWVPIDPELPPARQALLAADAAAVIERAADGALAVRAHGGRRREPGAAYVIFTSGSTGAPKGVIVEHAGLTNRLAWMRDDLGLSADDVFVQKTPAGFDVSVWELLLPLALGARLVIARPGGHRDPAYLADLLSQHRVTIAHFVPSMLREVADTPADALSGLRWLVTSGEALTPALLGDVRRRWPRLAVANLYGPTEATIDVTAWLCPPDAPVPTTVPIGRPVANTRVRVVDAGRRRLPPGVPGELALEGVQLARGYLDPEQTRASFVADPEDPRGRIYLTGDVVRWTPDGELHYLGRRDDQIKIRGVRIELDEIARTLERHPEVATAVAITEPGADGAPEAVIAYVAPREADARDPSAVARWAGVFDATYRAPAEDAANHLAGWNRTIDGAPYPPDVMREWIEGAVERIRRSAPRDVLEVGCGTGLLLFRIAPDTRRYVGLDIATSAVAHVKAHAALRGLGQVEARLGGADATADPELGSFDAVVLNSVVQYFPDAAYLEHALAGAIARVRDGGVVFVGDVRRLELLPDFALEVETGRAPAGTAPGRIAAAAAARVREEEELAVGPAFFAALAARADGPFARIADVVIEPKRGRQRDEMTVYRYDVTIRVGPRRTPPDARRLDWSLVGSPDRLPLASEGPVIVRGIPNGRLARGGVDPADLFALGDVGWDPDEPHALALALGGAALPSFEPDARATNDPATGARLRTLGRRVRDHAARHLPAALVPRTVTVLDRLPVTAHGKVDRAALPPPAAPPRAAYAPLASPTEELVAEAIAEVLGVDAPSAADGFFDLGGHSLLATRLVARLRAATGRDLALAAVFDTPTVRGIARALDGAPLAAAEPAVTAPDRAPLSYAQRRMVVLDALAAQPGLYTVPVALRIRGPLDLDALARAVEEVVRRHEPLRTRIVPAEPEPLQEAAPPFGLDGPVRALDAATLEEELAAFVREPFDLASGRLLRARVYRLGEDDHALALAVHHVAIDRWSLAVLLGEVLALLEGRSLPPLATTYRAHATAQRARSFDDGLAWWRAELDGAPRLTAIEGHPRPASRSAGARHAFRLDSAITAGIEALAARHGATPFMVLLAAFGAFLHRAGAGDDLVIGAPVAGRREVAAEGLIGLFVNTLPLRARIRPDLPFETHLANVRATTLAAYAHQDVPFEAIVAAVAPERTAGHEPLVQVMLVVQNVESPPLAARGLDLALLPAETRTSKLDLTLFAERDGAATACAFEYDRGIFDADTVRSFARALGALLGSAIAAPATPIGELAWLDREEETRIAALEDGPRLELPGDGLVGALARRAAAHPAAIAVEDGVRRLTYAELHERALGVAAALVEQGAGRGERVAILLPRSADAVVAIVAVLLAGASWVYVDPAAPPARRAAVLADAAPRVVLEGLPAGGLGRAQPADEDDPAYVLYTSGSTGAPKGVVVPRSALWNHTAWMQEAYPLHAGDRVLLRTALGFDASIWEVFSPLAAGARVVVHPPREPFEPAELVPFCEEHGVTVLQLVPTLLRAVLDSAGRLPRGLRRLFVGGEAFDEALRARVLALGGDVEVVNLYGPTEATIDATAWSCTAADVGPTPIGRPIANVVASVRDARGRRVPRGVAGELHLGGAGLALGYLGDEALTRERFFAPEGARLLRTGDRVRRRGDGALVFVGRGDDQVKVAGTRVELGEIESALLAHPDVAAAAAGLRDDRLVAWVVARRPVDDAAVRAFLLDRLPRAAVPVAFGRVDDVPRTTSGKIDRRALPAVAPPPAAASGDAPATEAEAALARVFADVLGAPHVGRDDDFFGLGGDSIQSLRLVARARAAGLVVTARDVFEASTVRALAARARPLVRAPAIPEDGSPIPLTAVQRWFFELDLAVPAHFNQSAMIAVGERIAPARLADAARRVADHHPILRARFRERVQTIGPAGDVFVRVEATGGFDDAAARIQGSLDLADGPLFRVALLDDGREERVLLVAHHLVVDAVSWSVLEEDLLAAYRGEPLADAGSFADHARRAPPPAEAPAADARPLPRDRDGAPTYATARAVDLDLDARPLERATGRDRGADAILLAALARAVGGWTGADTVDLVYEAHGRDGDLARAVGWFTVLHPLSLAVAPDAAAQLRVVLRALEAMRGAPARALGARPTELAFNWLGRLDPPRPVPGVRPAPEGRGPERAGANRLPFALDVTGAIRDGRLRVTFGFSEARHLPATIEAVARRFEADLLALVAVEKATPELGTARLSPRELARVLAAAGKRGRK